MTQIWTDAWKGNFDIEFYKAREMEVKKNTELVKNIVATVDVKRFDYMAENNNVITSAQKDDF